MKLALGIHLLAVLLVWGSSSLRISYAPGHQLAAVSRAPVFVPAAPREEFAPDLHFRAQPIRFDNDRAGAAATTLVESNTVQTMK